MYIEIHDWHSFEQKTLYFKLNNAFNMCINDGLNYKIAGIYAIFKDDICLYVGQSKNIASRLATHISGKYKAASKIEIFDIKDIGFSDYLERSKESQAAILDNCEKYLMSELEPIENLNIDMDFKLDEAKSPDMYDGNELVYSYKIILDKDYLTIVDDISSMYIESICIDIDAASCDIKPYEIDYFDILNNLSKLDERTVVEKRNG